MKKSIFFILLGFLSCTLIQAKNLKNETPSTHLVSVSIPPQAFFVKKIAGDTLNINILLPQNNNEHNFEFKASAMKKLEKSDIYFTIGLEFEKIFMSKFKQNFPKLQIENMQKNIALIVNHEQDHHSHKHENFDPHTWLDPILVQTMALNIYNVLIQKYPQNKKLYKQNLDQFLAQLDSLNLQIASKLEKLKNREFVVYHPSWAYFAKRYNLTQIPVEILGKEPKSKDLQNLITMMKNKNITIIFVQNNFPENAAKALAKESHAQIYKINHLSYEWENELLKTANALSKNL
ncbi:zinc ABC transporter substrate-binding protein [Campylobacter hepaticus]|uniref:ABC transporter substrate-binding protein n=1 Tax=Campylobacter hepaticus TaxID=1813019 RepID=A0A424Z0X5_9BACT|nr:zinc ABC transporter substrate-binding protein [Campylobacter hepaticus]AXP09124.1 ABC transporter substrate-binding protein [Campylobacter hepaticus]MCZ0771616.1 zinc ABC transporter substrate-binding protein [Campylobacter hepaticus]MCZ0773084.1 zinc ABC transporter substrate-binding protein [Campylobacter hepaticus]MCZ0775764.1 zinc ABC transporter substrate-binding protein [Campylobacter hepaticus]MDX2323457.1 zinc ABC transporter substrate-binding protein [Campylobacter hepaticus]